MVKGPGDESGYCHLPRSPRYSHRPRDPCYRYPYPFLNPRYPYHRQYPLNPPPPPPHMRL